jgi:hypothetical protein
VQIELTADGEERIQQHAHTLLGGDEITNPLSDAREARSAAPAATSHPGL